MNLFSGGASLRTKFYDRLVLGFFPDQGTILNRANRLRQERRRLLVETAGRATGKQASWLDSLEAGLATETAAAEARRLAVGRCLLAPLADLRPPFCHLKLNFIGACQTADAKTLHTYAAALESPLATNQEVAPVEASVSVAPLTSKLADQLKAGRAEDALSGRTKVSPSQFDFITQFADESGAWLAADSASTGEEKRALLSLLLAGASALAKYHRPPLLLLDEVVAHLDSAVAEALFIALDGLGSQVWASGQELTAFPAQHFLRLRLEVGGDGSRAITALT